MSPGLEKETEKKVIVRNGDNHQHVIKIFSILEKNPEEVISSES